MQHESVKIKITALGIEPTKIPFLYAGAESSCPVVILPKGLAYQEVDKAGENFLPSGINENHVEAIVKAIRKKLGLTSDPLVLMSSDTSVICPTHDF